MGISRHANPDAFGRKRIGGMFGAVEAGEAAAVEYYNDWKAEVLSQVPKERLLVWHAKEGWKPLYNFLGVPVPDVPFPNVNDTPSVLANLRKIKRIRNILWAIIIGGFAASVY